MHKYSDTYMQGFPTDQVYFQINFFFFYLGYLKFVILILVAKLQLRVWDIKLCS